MMDINGDYLITKTMVDGKSKRSCTKFYDKSKKKTTTQTRVAASLDKE